VIAPFGFSRDCAVPLGYSEGGEILAARSGQFLCLAPDIAPSGTQSINSLKAAATVADVGLV